MTTETTGIYGAEPQRVTLDRALHSDGHYYRTTVYVDGDGTCRVWDSVAGHLTIHTGLRASALARARERGLRLLATGRALDAAGYRGAVQHRG